MIIFRYHVERNNDNVFKFFVCFWLLRVYNILVSFCDPYERRIIYEFIKKKTIRFICKKTFDGNKLYWIGYMAASVYLYTNRILLMRNSSYFRFDFDSNGTSKNDIICVFEVSRGFHAERVLFLIYRFSLPTGW